MKKIWVLTAVICMLFLFLCIMPVHGESEIYDNVLRLHVLANSDSEADQALKIKVRDAVLSESEKIFASCKTREEAIIAVNENTELLEAAAKKVIEEEGYSYPVSIEFGEEEYPTRNYESTSFPSGKYLSLRIIIGEGKGENWWCVLFPPMCLSAASKSSTEDAFISVGLNKDQYSIITQTENPTYNVRFKLLEVIESSIN